ncbi:hypothetical protein PTSG_10176 [Salpingoeca rosetta]|uniref:CHCH domain-containing protein n=1 Tax=Salpingoeca rosetta (strain ATCC 50818 / BSB-021) TaxID=946362 RepID=F2UQI7_SALR5|nr:uncharacterized protein PTSG_10176 [Salpingoeca rosetta]EGD79892.1 hypothetical protein PTSG_10176 [Salpingoeca rosetta]|eukprot:XP_004988513.1 hypothetical protein PTSG_10176 [Salpingoeca rosetta]
MQTNKTRKRNNTHTTKSRRRARAAMSAPRPGHGRPVRKEPRDDDDEEEEEEDPYDVLVEKSGCKQEHFALLDCMEESNRDWRKCQGKVRELKECMAKQQAAKQLQQTNK